MDRAAKKFGTSKVLSSTIGRVVVTAGLIAIVFGLVTADRYLKDWDPVSLTAQVETADSGTPRPMSFAPVPEFDVDVNHKFILPDPVFDSVEVSDSEIAIDKLNTDEEPEQPEVDTHPSIPRIRINGMIFLFRMDFGTCRIQVCL